MLGTANGLHHAINQTSKIAGPAMGGLLLALIPAQAVFGINAVLSLLAAALVWGIALPVRSKPETEAPTKFLADLFAGVAEFRRSRLLLAALVFSSVAYFAFFLYDALIALLTQEFGLGATAFGISIAASGGGGLLGAILAGRLAVRWPMATMIWAAIFSGLVTLALALAAIVGYALPELLFYAVMALAGGSTAFMLVPYRTIVQREAPPDRIARVFAAGEAIIMAVMLSAPFIGSAIAAAYGTPVAFAAGGAMLIALGLASSLVLALTKRA
jgi:predicted MFS family arabinose efflux permease